MKRPFDEARYRVLLEGLEAAEVRLSYVLSSAQTFRFDPEYYERRHLQDAAKLKSASSRFRSFSAAGLTVDASAFYPSIEQYYDQGDLPFLRVADVDSVIDFDTCTCIPADLCDRFPTLAKVNPGDIVFTKGGSVARIGLVTESAAVSRDLIFINTSRLPEEDQTFLYVYFQTDFFNRALLRSSSQTAQPHLTITLVRDLSLLLAGDELKEKCLQFVQAAFTARARALRHVAESSRTLLSALGLAEWQAPDPLTYVRSSRDVFASGRADAEFHRPRVEAAESELKSQFVLQKLGTSTLFKGATVPYANDGTVPIIRSGDLTDIDDDAKFLRAHEDAEIFKLERGDVLVSSIGFGSIGKVQVFDKPGRYGTVSEVTVIRDKRFNPYYVAAFLRSPVGQLQIDRYITGATGQLHLYARDVAKFWIPVLPSDTQRKFEQFALDARNQKARAKLLLDTAKRAVEIAIESSEQCALAHLNSLRQP